MKIIKLKKDKSASVLRFHPWVFSGAMQYVEKSIEDGDVVGVHDAQGMPLGMAIYSEGTSIALRMLHFGDLRPIDAAFWREKLANALALRAQLGFLQNSETNCFRWIHAEGDGVPGLVIDVYNDVAVMQCHTLGIYMQRKTIGEALMYCYPHLQGVFDKSADTLHNYKSENALLLGTAPDKGIVSEDGLNMRIDWAEGQKTGFFLDQRDNRQLLQQYAKGKTVLNAFCYTGGFSVHALKANAKKVDSVDVSAKAISLCDENVALNGYTNEQHSGICADVLQFLKTPPEQYDVLIIDPPAFAKNIAKRHNAVQGYRRLNEMAFRASKPGSIIFTFSCSQVIDRPLFQNTIVAAALDAGKQARILHHLSQPADHPVSIHHPEGSYLKGLVLQVQ